MTSDDGPGGLDPRGLRRVLRRLDHLVRTGRVTADEAARLQDDAPPDVQDGAIRDVRVRHGAERLQAAVEAGRVTGDEADAVLARLRAGEHSPELRADIGRLLQREPAPHKRDDAA